jgi:hypothetical protein
MRVMGKSYATVGPSYDAGTPAYLSGAQLNATVNLDGATGPECTAVRSELVRIGVSAVLSRSPASCGNWQRLPGSDWLFWKISSAQPTC